MTYSNSSLYLLMSRDMMGVLQLVITRTEASGMADNQQQYHRRHIHQVKVKDIKEEADKTLKMPPQPFQNINATHILPKENT